MQEKNIKKIANLLETHHEDLGFVLTKSQQILRINEKILPLIEPKILREYCIVANLSSNKLTILVANSSYATQLKFQSSHLLTKIKKLPDLTLVAEIIIKVKPYYLDRLHTKKNKQAKLLSVEIAHIIKNIASNITDPTLRQVMEKIASRVEK